MTERGSLPFGAGCLIAQLAGLVAIPIFFLKAWIASTLWCWFVVPQWSVDTLSVPVAAGLLALISVVHHEIKPTKDKLSNDPVTLTSEIVGLYAGGGVRLSRHLPDRLDCQGVHMTKRPELRRQWRADQKNLKLKVRFREWTPSRFDDVKQAIREARSK